MTTRFKTRAPIKPGRTEAFSDGVFGFAATLLVLSIKLPSPGTAAEVTHAILSAWPAYATYTVSFMTIGIVWLNHHGIFVRLRAVDRPLQALNLLLLMIVAFIPFPTAFLSQSLQSAGDQSVASIFYGLTFTVMGALASSIWMYAIRRDLLHEAIDARQARASLKRFAIGTPAYPIAMVVSVFNARAGLGLFAVVVLFYLFDALPSLDDSGQLTD